MKTECQSSAGVRVRQLILHFKNCRDDKTCCVQALKLPLQINLDETVQNVNNARVVLSLLATERTSRTHEQMWWQHEQGFLCSVTLWVMLLIRIICTVVALECVCMCVHLSLVLTFSRAHQESALDCKWALQHAARPGWLAGCCHGSGRWRDLPMLPAAHCSRQWGR